MVVDARIEFDVRSLRDSTERWDVHIKRSTPHNENIQQFLLCPHFGVDTIKMASLPGFRVCALQAEMDARVYAQPPTALLVSLV